MTEMTPAEAERAWAEMQALQVEQEAQREAMYRGVGRYIFEFSRLVSWMRWLLVKFLTPAQEPEELAQLVLGQATAQYLAEAFVSVCVERARLDGDDKKIAGILLNQLRSEISRRNDIAHGDWTVGWGSPVPTLARIKPAAKTTPFTTTEYTAENFETAAREVVALRSDVLEFGALCLGEIAMPSAVAGASVSDIFTTRKKKRTRADGKAERVDIVVREGSRAAEFGGAHFP